MSKRIPCKRCSGNGYIYVTYSEGNTGTATSHICPECCGAGVQFAPSTNADRIRAMSDEELAEFIRSIVDGSYNYNFACYEYTNYATHHSDPANKGIYIHKCDDFESEGIGLDVLKWLQQPAEEEQI